MPSGAIDKIGEDALKNFVYTTGFPADIVERYRKAGRGDTTGDLFTALQSDLIFRMPANKVLESQKAAGGRSVTLVLKDANNKTVAEKTLVTDDFGTLSTYFVLPKGGLTGSFAIRVNNVSGGYASFRVEEYKRPAFYVEFDKVTEKYENGDTLTVTGRAKSYAGVPVQGATVEYSVDRDVALWWRYGFYGAYSGGADDGNLAEGETTTDAQGEFKIKMPIVLPKWEDTGDDGGNDVDYRVPRFYNFTVKADVTDQAGETHNGELTLPLGTKPTAFGCEMPSKTLRDSLKTITFTL